MNRIIGGTAHEFRVAPISWCGEYAATGALCFGLENGWFVVPPERPTGEPRFLETGATEPINGVAFAGRHVALTTRGEVIVLERRDDPAQVEIHRLDHAGGAHDVAAAAGREAFVAAIGPDGLLIATPSARGPVELQVGQGPDRPFNCCRIVRLAGAPGEDVFAVAARTDGLLIARPFQEDAPLVSRRFPGHDVVDVRPLHDPEFPRAALCVSRERGLFFLEDVLSDDPPVGIVYQDVQGVAYSIAVVAGHVFLLTDREFLTFPGLASRFLRDRPSLRRPLGVMATSSDAFELAAFRDKVLLLEDGAAVEYDAADLAGVGAEGVTIVKRILAPIDVDRDGQSPRRTRLEMSVA